MKMDREIPYHFHEDEMAVKEAVERRCSYAVLKPGQQLLLALVELLLRELAVGELVVQAADLGEGPRLMVDCGGGDRRCRRNRRCRVPPARPARPAPNMAAVPPPPGSGGAWECRRAR